jgi:hypothetical protein
VQHPSKLTHACPNPLLGRFRQTFDSFETKVEVPVGVFTLKPGDLLWPFGLYSPRSLRWSSSFR